MTPKKMNNSLRKLLARHQLTSESENKIYSIMQQVDQLTFISDSMKLDFCLEIIRTLQKSNDKQYTEKNEHNQQI